jgi:hypothetical protein
MQSDVYKVRYGILFTMGLPHFPPLNDRFGVRNLTLKNLYIKSYNNILRHHLIIINYHLISLSLFNARLGT